MEIEKQDPQSQIIQLNVGGRRFQTTRRTFPFPSSSDDSLIDRDPSLFSHLLSLLRSPHSIPHHSKSLLIREASFYGPPVLSALRSALAPPPLLGHDSSLISTLLPTSEPFVTALSAADDGSLFLAHGGLISAYDSQLQYQATLRTHLDRITSLSRVNAPPLLPGVAVAGSLHKPGLHLYDLSKGTHLGFVQWSDPSDTRLEKSWVTAIALPSSTSSPSPLFASFEAAHRENCILCIDPGTLQVTAEIGRQSGIAARSAAATRIAHLPELGGTVLMSSVSSGAFGYSGYMRIWDPRSGDAVWETSEPGGRNSTRFGDPFSDVDVDAERLVLYKVCWKSGDVGMADLRMLGDNDPWVYLSDPDGRAGEGGGVGSMIHCYKGGQVFVGRQLGLEVWSQLQSQSQLDQTTKEAATGWRRNWVDGEEEAAGRGVVRRMEVGGDRLFLCRQGLDGVQVWETSHLSRPISLL